MKINKLLYALFLIVLVFSLSGCYGMTVSVAVNDGEVILEMQDGTTVTNVGGSGRYSNGAWYANYQIVDGTIKTFIWQDGSLATSSKQVVGVTIAVQVRRPNETESAQVMKAWKFYKSEMQSDESLQAFVFSQLASSAKNETSKHTLDEILGAGGSETGRSNYESNIAQDLTPKLASAGFVLIAVSLTDVTPSPAYLDLLDQNARITAKTEQVKEETKQQQEILKQEEIKTQTSLEIAKRDRLVAEEEAKVLAQSQETYELKKLQTVMNGLNETDKVFFIQPGQDISLFLGATQPVTTTK